jgi:hypothetical protein
MTCYVFYKITRPSFSTDKWIQATPKIRGYLCKDLLKKYDLKNMLKDDIIKLLGQPDDKTRKYWYELSESGSTAALVPVRKFTLVFRIDDNNQVIEYYDSRRPQELENNEFESNKWRDGSPDVRRRMFNSLIRNTKLEGMHKSEIEKLLGNFDGCYDRFYYDVGDYGGRFISLGYYLIINFDERERVTEYFVDD